MSWRTKGVSISLSVWELKLDLKAELNRVWANVAAFMPSVQSHCQLEMCML